MIIKITEREVQFTGGGILPETPVGVGLVWRGGPRPVLLDVVLSQEDSVLEVGQGGAEVLGLVGLPALVETITLGYTASNVHTETGHRR